MRTNPSGLCMCGCGNKTNLSKQTLKRNGRERGKPNLFILGHSAKKKTPYYIKDPKTGCWNWSSVKINGARYGTKNINGKVIQAHRWLYERFVGPIPDGLEIDHLCRNRACVNPEHLEPVTRAENIRRGSCTKLSKEDVIEIRRLCDSGQKTKAELSRMYNMTDGHISEIVRRLIWKGV